MTGRTDTAPDAGPAWNTWDDFAASGDRGLLPGVENDENRLHEIVFTSGTTGQAKGVMRTQRGRILDSAFAALGYQLNRDDHLLGILPQFHVGGGAVPNQLLLQGGRVTILRQYDPLAMAKALETGVTYIVGVPAHYSLLFESGHLDGIDTSRGPRGATWAAAPPSPPCSARSRRTSPGRARARLRLDRVGPAHAGAARAGVPGSLRVAWPAGRRDRVRVVTDTGTDAADDEVGELWVRSDSVMSGYLGAAGPDRGGVRRGRLAEDGRPGAPGRRRVLHPRRPGQGHDHLGRRERLPARGRGHHRRRTRNIAEVAVVGAPDPLYEERVTAFVRLADPAQPFDEAELQAYVRERLAGFKVPRTVYVIDELPRTGVGKVSKPQLRERLARESA